MITVTVTPANLSKKLVAIPDTVFDPEFRRTVLEAEGLAKLAVSGPVLRVRTGRLRSSINSRVDRTGDVWTGEIGSSVKYAAIHEFGGVIPAHRVVPKNASVLRFTLAGKVVFSMYADIPTIVMPPRPYLRPSAQTAADNFVTRLGNIDLVKASKA